MVEIINQTVTRGVAGRRGGAVKGVVFHNTWGNSTACLLYTSPSPRD